MSILGSRFICEGATHELVESVENYESYEWDAVGIFRRLSDGRLFWATDSGCSCNSAWEDATEADLEPLTVDALARLIERASVCDDITERQNFIRAAQAMVAGG